MRRLAVLGLLLLTGSAPARADDAPAVSLSDGRTGQIRFESVTPSGYFALARRDGLPKAIVVGTLRLPSGATERASAMVVAHGSAGVDEREQAWAERLVKAGIAAFVVDSFTPRNIRQTATDQSLLSTAANVADALAALRLLATHPRLDPARIGVIGFSKGGQVALYTALEPFRRAVIEGDTRFAAHVALYPYCNDWYVAEHVTGAPMLLLLGGRDDYTPPAPCRGYAEWFTARGAPASVIVYPNAYHDFDSTRPPTVGRAFVSGRNCDMRVDLDRFTVTLRATGEDITATSTAYARGCLTRGATVGGDAEARRRAPADVTAFLQKAFAR